MNLLKLYVKNKCKASTILERLKNFVNLKQTNDKSLVDYTMRFKLAQAIQKSLFGGRLHLKKFLAESQPGWDKTMNANNTVAYKSIIRVICLYVVS